MALASGEGRTAMDKARKAERFLNKPELTNLLTAQAAELSGDKHKATEVYKRLLSDDSTRFVGVRGLMRQKLEGSIPLLLERFTVILQNYEQALGQVISNNNDMMLKI